LLSELPSELSAKVYPTTRRGGAGKTLDWSGFATQNNLIGACCASMPPAYILRFDYDSQEAKRKLLPRVLYNLTFPPPNLHLHASLNLFFLW